MKYTKRTLPPKPMAGKTRVGLKTGDLKVGRLAQNRVLSTAILLERKQESNPEADSGICGSPKERLHPLPGAHL